MTTLTEDRIKHLEMIQGIISRMAGESARMKQFGLTVVGILASTSTAVDVPSLAWVGVALTIVFWVLDARYLQQERQFRAHYDEIRLETGPTDFRMALSSTATTSNSVSDALFGWSTSLIYGALLLISLFIVFGVNTATPGT